MTNNQLTDNFLQDVYGVAVSCEVAEREGAYMAAFDLLCKMDDAGGTAHVVRKLIDMLRSGRAEFQENRKALIPAGWKLVPIEPTEGMIVDGFESEPDEDFSDAKVWAEYEAMSGCQQAAHRAKLCWTAMLSAAPTAPKKENI